MQQVTSIDISHLEAIQPGDVVALIGDFSAVSIAELIWLIDRKAIVVPLTGETRLEHPYFFANSLADWVIEQGKVERLPHAKVHHLIDGLRDQGKSGLVLFSTGTTGRPKAILHDVDYFLKRFETPRPSFRTMAFLLFDHIGGLNTLFHTMFNSGVVVIPSGRSIAQVLESCRTHEVEVLPTTPTFLRMMLMSGVVPEGVPRCLKVITYGTERMDQNTLNSLCEDLPNVDFRQTYGMSEVGILRVKSKGRCSVLMQIGGEGVKTRINSGVLEILSPTRMLGYLNADLPFDDEGWYSTGDIVEVEDNFMRIVGRRNEVMNVGGLKFMASEVERVALQHPMIALASVERKLNPITGEHVELTVESASGKSLDLQELKEFFRERLPRHMIPRRINLQNVSVSHRFKRL